MTDRELLEAAAKAAGVYYWTDGEVWSGALITHGETPGSSREWNPLTDDGDALRLAVAIRAHMVFTDKTVQIWESEEAPRALSVEWLQPNHYAATRRAIVRAAAEIGRTK